MFTGKSSKRPEHEIRKTASNELTITNLTYERVSNEDQVQQTDICSSEQINFKSADKLLPNFENTSNFIDALF